MIARYNLAIRGIKFSERSFKVKFTHLDREADEGAGHGAQDEIPQIQRCRFQHVTRQLIFGRAHDQNIGVRAKHGELKSSHLVFAMNLFTG